MRHRHRIVSPHDHVTVTSRHFVSFCQVLGGSLLGLGPIRLTKFAWLGPGPSFPGTTKCRVNTKFLARHETDPGPTARVNEGLQIGSATK